MLSKDYRWEGEKIVKKIKVRRSNGVTYGQDGMALPPDLGSQYIDSEVKRCFAAVNCEVTVGALAAAKTSKDACISTVKDRLDGMREAKATLDDFFVFRDGTGKVATVVSHSGTALVVDDARGLWRGAWYTARDAETPATINCTLQVSHVALSPSSGNADVTLAADPGVTLAVGDTIYWGRGEHEAYNLAPQGLESLIGTNTGTLQSIALASYPEWHSIIFSPSTGSQVQDPHLHRQMLASLFQRNSTKNVDLTVVGSVWDVLEFEELWQGEVRTTPRATIAGLTAPVFHSHFGRFMPVSAQQAPYGKLFFIDRRELSRAVSKELDWFKNEGGGIFRVAGGNTVAYQASMVEIYQNMVGNRSVHGVMDTLSNEKKIMY